MCGTWQIGNWICDGSLNSNYFSDKGRRENALQPPLLTLLDDGLPKGVTFGETSQNIEANLLRIA